MGRPPSPGQAPEGAPAAPRNTLQMQEELPAFLEGNAGRAGGGGRAAARCQMCTVNSCPRLIRSAPGSSEPALTAASACPAPACFPGRPGGGTTVLPTRSGLGGRDQNPRGGEVGARKTHCTPPTPPPNTSLW